MRSSNQPSKNSGYNYKLKQPSSKFECIQMYKFTHSARDLVGKPHSLIAMYIFPSKHEKQQIATHIFRMQLQIKTPSPKLKCTYKSTYSCTKSFRGLDFHLKFKSSRYYNSQSELQLHIFLMNFLNSFQIGLMGLVFFRFIRFP